MDKTLKPMDIPTSNPNFKTNCNFLNASFDFDILNGKKKKRLTAFFQF